MAGQTREPVPYHSLWRVRYRDNDPGCPVFSCILRADDREHAELAFHDLGDPDDTDWTIVSIEREHSR